VTWKPCAQRLTLYPPHFPPGFSPANGIKSLFPTGYTGSISILSAYVYEKAGRVTKLPQYDYSYYVAADGAGRWFFGWTAYISVSGFNLRIQAGFTFNYSNDGFGHGYMDSSRPDPNIQSCNQGQDV
jgi:hypothetical protein